MRPQILTAPGNDDATSLWFVLQRRLPKIVAAAAILGLVTFGGLSLLSFRTNEPPPIANAGRAADPATDSARDLASAVRAVTATEADIARLAGRVQQLRGSTQQAGGIIDRHELDAQTERANQALLAKTAAADRARVVRDVLQRGGSDLATLPEMRSAPVVQAVVAQLQRAQRDKAEAETVLLPTHPRMQQHNTGIAELQRQLATEGGRVVDALEVEAKALEESERIEREKLDVQRTSFTTLTTAVAELQGLEAAARVKRADLERLRSSPPVQPVAGVSSSVQPTRTTPWLRNFMTAALVMLTTVLALSAAVAIRAWRSGPAPEQRGSPTLPMPLRPTSPGSGYAPSDVASGTDPTIGKPAIFDRLIEPDDETGAFVAQTSIAQVANRLIGNAEVEGGYRTVIVGEGKWQDIREEAAGLAAALCAAGKQVALVDWSVDGYGIAEALGVESEPGFMDLVEGRATFDQVIRRLPDGNAHILPCGSGQTSLSLDPDHLNVVLDALDEVYDHIIVTGEQEAITTLFIAIEGRFDAGVLIGDDRIPDAPHPLPGTFLGIEVTDIDLLRLVTAAPVRTPVHLVASSTGTGTVTRA